MSAPKIVLSFPHYWSAKILSARPAILPARHFTYPNEAEEVERGALEVLVRPESERLGAPSFPRRLQEGWENRDPDVPSPMLQPFLATCALGFKDPAVPAGIWSTPNPDELCAISGGYAYIIDTTAPEKFTMLPYRPVLQVRPIPEHNLLIFIGHHAILAWGADDEAWQSPKLSDEGVTITTVEGSLLHGLGWNLITDKETPFALDLRTGTLISATP